jgi:hypothetical protein
MRKVFQLLLLCSIVFASLLLPKISTAQNIKLSGTVTDSLSFIPAMNVQVVLTNKTTLKSDTQKTNINGQFVFINNERGFYSLSISGKNYQAKNRRLRLMEDRSIKLYILPTVNQIKKVKLKTEADITIKGDTIQYNADSFKTQDNASAEDLVKKLPGVTTENGNINAQGEEVKRVLVDGKAYFGDDPKAALKNLPSEAVKKVEVYDDKTDKAKFTGFDDGESVKTINIITKPSMRNGVYGRIYAGYGTDEFYNAGASISKTSSKGRISLIAQSNNINQQNFSLDDVLGLLGSSGSSYRGRPTRSNGAPFARPGSSLYNFYVDNQNGITQTNALGLNYAGIINSKISVSASYFISNLDNENEQLTNRTFFSQDGLDQNYNERLTSNANSLTHRINGRLEWNIDTNNKLVYIPSFTFQDINSINNIFGETDINDTLLNKSSNLTSGENNGLRFNNRLIYQHRFKKPGSTITFRGNANFAPSNGTNNLFAENLFFNTSANDSIVIDQLTTDEQTGNTYSGDFSYTHLLTPKDQLEISTDYSVNYNDRSYLNNTLNANSNEYNVLDTGLSSLFKNVTQTISGGLRIRHNKSKAFRYSYGIALQQTTLNSEQTFPIAANIPKTFYALVPKVFVRWKPSKFKRFFAFYRIRPNIPSVLQLQEVVNNSNPLSLYKGNSNLQQQNNHFLVSRMSSIKPFKGKSFFAFVLFNASNNYIGNKTTLNNGSSTSSTIEIPRGGQLTEPVNLSGYYNGIVSLNKGLKLKKLKSNLNTSVRANVGRTPSQINDVLNFNRNYNFTLRANLTSNISKKLDFNLGVSFNQVFVSNSVQKELDYNFSAPGANGKIFWQFYKNWFAELETNYTVYQGLNEGFNTSILLLNPAIGYRSSKNVWELKLYGFDALNQNQAISRTVQQTYVEDVNSLVIQQYFMVQALYNIKKFKKGSEPAYQPQRRRPGS